MLKVSVIIPAYNAEKYLGEAIESVLAQEIEELEILVINDGSSDRTAEIALTYPKVRLINQVNLGIPYSRNKGVLESVGQYISFIDADDLWTNQKLIKQIKVLETEPKVEIVDGFRRNFLEPGVKKPAWLPDQSFTNNSIVTFGITETLIRRELFDKIGLFDEYFKQQEDVEWYLRARDKGVEIKVLPEICLHRRIHEKNISFNRAKSTHYLCSILAKSIKRKNDRHSID